MTPANGSPVSRQGFDVAWTPSGDANVRVDIEISGFGPDGADEDKNPDRESRFLSNLRVRPADRSGLGGAGGGRGARQAGGFADGGGAGGEDAGPEVESLDFGCSVLSFH